MLGLLCERTLQSFPVVHLVVFMWPVGVEVIFFPIHLQASEVLLYIYGLFFRLWCLLIFFPLIYVCIYQQKFATIIHIDVLLTLAYMISVIVALPVWAPTSQTSANICFSPPQTLHTQQKVLKQGESGGFLKGEIFEDPPHTDDIFDQKWKLGQRQGDPEAVRGRGYGNKRNRTWVEPWICEMTDIIARSFQQWRKQQHGGGKIVFRHVFKSLGLTEEGGQSAIKKESYYLKNSLQLAAVTVSRTASHVWAASFTQKQQGCW